VPASDATPLRLVPPLSLPTGPTPERPGFDAAALTAAIAADLAAPEAPREAAARRALAVRRIAAAREAAAARIEADFRAAPLDGRRLVAAQTALTDAVVTVVLDTARQLAGAPATAERLALVAVGGYGRAELAPYSDIDLMVLFEKKPSRAATAVVETMLYMLWDLRLKLGHATRTLRECLRLAREDMTVRTSLLEHRFLAGDPGLARDLDARLRAEVLATSGPAFIEAKLLERTERHRKQGGQRYVLEPNVKEGKGGLRDLQTLYWIGKHLHGVRSAADLVAVGLFTAEEYDIFRRAEDFLLTVRCHLHLIAGRAMDQLTFDMQVEVAERMGYRDAAGRRAVEHFMQDYFRHATRVGELTRVFLTALEARHVKGAPPLERLFQRPPKVGRDYTVVHGRLSVADPATYFADPMKLLRLFEEGLRTGLLIHPDAMRQVAANLHRIDDRLRENPEAAALFLRMLLDHGNPERALRRMNELGVLAAFIPEFEPIVAMMQFNVYHHYTVDEHTIQCISQLAQIERGELVEELPVASGILEAGVNRRILYVALFLHDIGKGRPEDHSIVGARIARKVAPRLGLDAEESETVEWLVRHHLLMSDTAQKRDIAEPRTVRDFARAVRSRRRLDLLTVLTVCDIRGVGPNTWNNWKATLLRRLYRDTADALDMGLEAAGRERREDEAKEALRAALGDWPAEDVERELARHYGPYWQGLPTATHAVFARLLRAVAPGEIAIDLHPDEAYDATRAAFVLEDHPGIFSRLAGALALVGANVVDARTYTSKDGYATAVFWVQDEAGHPYEAARLPRLTRMIQRTLKGEVVAREALKDRDKPKRRERAFSFPTTVTFDNEASDIYTLIEVDTRDRPGLLYDLTRTLAANHIYIASAVIATYGAQAVDTFYVKDMFGLKLYAKSKREALEKKLRQAIAEGAARAGG
jgi:[protein-PII] uridylyltransferase